nr:MAG TPA: hypothetical protein [Caudoviricetes sp.]
MSNVGQFDNLHRCQGLAFGLGDLEDRVGDSQHIVHATLLFVVKMKPPPTILGAVTRSVVLFCVPG